MICEILGLYVHTLTVDDKYCPCNKENSPQPIQRQLSKKTCFEFLPPFLKSSSNFKHFEKKMILIACLFPNWQTVKDLVGPMSKTRHFRTPFDSQHVKGYQTLAKSAWQNFYHIFSSLWGRVTWKMFPLVIIEIWEYFVNILLDND